MEIDVNNKKFSIKSFDVIPVKETKLNIIRLKNVRMFPQDKSFIDNESVYIPGKTFLSIFHYHYHHFFIDTVAQYEYIKKYVDNLNIEFITDDDAKSWRNENNLDRNPQLFKDYLKTKHFGYERKKIDLGVEQHKYFEGIFDYYNNDLNKLIYSSHVDNIFFEEIYFLVDDFHFFPLEDLEDVGLTGNDIPWLSKEWKATTGHVLFEYWEKILWELEGIRCASKSIRPNLVKNNLSPKKIYISRQLANKRYIQEKAKLNFWAVDKNLKARVFKKEYLIENFFVKNGYTSVTLEGMSFMDQMNLFYNATHVASLSGSGLVNMVACDENTTITEIRAIVEFGYCYHDYGRALGFNHNLVESRDNQDIKYDIQKELEKIVNEI